MYFLNHQYSKIKRFCVKNPLLFGIVFALVIFIVLHFLGCDGKISIENVKLLMYLLIFAPLGVNATLGIICGLLPSKDKFMIQIQGVLKLSVFTIIFMTLYYVGILVLTTQKPTTIIATTGINATLATTTATIVTQEGQNWFYILFPGIACLLALFGMLWQLIEHIVPCVPVGEKKQIDDMNKKTTDHHHQGNTTKRRASLWRRRNRDEWLLVVIHLKR